MARESRWCHGAPVEPTQGKFKYFQINAIFFIFRQSPRYKVKILYSWQQM